MIWYQEGHIRRTNSTYFRHMRRTLTIAAYAAKITTSALLHTFVPNLVPWCASETCEELHDFICNNTDHECDGESKKGDL